ncbi:MAG: dTDP-4-dehydrorhamnose reductase [Coriobacteriia bacterium]|nr:dTDP-4-dehydrorhamnose reductase [Coriobacteriia bacterium]
MTTGRRRGRRSSASQQQSKGQQPKQSPKKFSRAYLIAGASGMLGTALQRVLRERAVRFVAPAEGEFDITDMAAVKSVVIGFAKSLRDGETGVIVNAAAYTNVERAEEEPELALLVNERGAVNLARAAHEAGLGFVHVSTDFVFDGLKEGAYAEDDEPHPLSVYGETKLAGEDSVAAENPDALIVRTAWVFGPAGANFPVKILEAARTRPELKVVTDEVGSPTYTIDLAQGILGLVDAGASGIFHLAGSGSCSRFEMATEILRIAGLDTQIEPVTSDEFPTVAARPMNSVLDCTKASALGVSMPDWHDSLARFLVELDGPAA